MSCIRGPATNAYGPERKNMVLIMIRYQNIYELELM